MGLLSGAVLRRPHTIFSAHSNIPILTAYYLPFGAETFAPVTPENFQKLLPALAVYDSSSADRLLYLLSSNDKVASSRLDVRLVRLVLKPAGNSAWRIMVDAKGTVLDSRRKDVFLLSANRLTEIHSFLISLQKQAETEAGLAVSKGDRALLSAIDQGQTRQVSRLLSQGVSPNVRQRPRGETALMRAAYHGSIDTCRVLLAAGASINSTSDSGNTALSYAALWGRQAVFDFLLQKGADTRGAEGQKALIFAAEGGHTAMVAELLRRGVDVNSVDRDKNTALMMAVDRGRSATVRLLLANGARVDQKDNQFRTALLGAAARGNDELVNLLLDRGADVNYDMGDGYTPLVSAVKFQHISTVKLLFKRGAAVTEEVLKEAREKADPLLLKLLKPD